MMGREIQAKNLGALGEEIKGDVFRIKSS